MSCFQTTRQSLPRFAQLLDIGTRVNPIQHHVAAPLPNALKHGILLVLSGHYDLAMHILLLLVELSSVLSQLPSAWSSGCGRTSDMNKTCRL